MKQIKNIIFGYLKKNRIKCIVVCITFLLASLLALLPAKFTQLIIDDGFLKKDYSIIVKYAFVLLLIYCGKVIGDFYSNRIFIDISSGILKKIKDEIYNRILFIDMKFFSNEVGYINSRINEIHNIDALFSTQTLNMVSLIVQFICALIILININWKFLLIMMIPLPFFVIIAFMSTKKISKQIRDSFDDSAKYSGKINESLSGMESIRTQALETKEKDKISEYNNRMINSAKKQSNTFNGFSSSLSLLSNLYTVLTYVIGGIFCVKNEMSFGEFLAISTYMGKLYSPVFSSSSMILLLEPALVSIRRVGEFFFSNSNDKGKDEIELIDNIKSVKFENVDFEYEKRKVLKNLSFQINSGEKILLGGKNGSGKSTICRLILKLYTVTKGEILINGKNINKIKKASLIDNIVYVPQKCFMFNDTIENNIRYGINIIDEKLYKQTIIGLGIDKLTDRIKCENNGFVGENGKNLSGGEIQKIALCKAICRKPKFIILDEATTNLDEMSKMYIKEYLKKLDAICIIIDHTRFFNDICSGEINL